MTPAPEHHDVERMRRIVRRMSYWTWGTTFASAAVAGLMGADWYSTGSAWSAFICGVHTTTFIWLILHGAAYRAISRFHLKVVEQSVKELAILSRALATVRHMDIGSASDIAESALQQTSARGVRWH